MPATTSNLYFRLLGKADDDGFVGNKGLAMQMAKASEDDLRILQAKNYILLFPSGVLVIVHWKIHNYIQKDRYKETIYKHEKSLVLLDKNDMYTFCIQIGNTGKDSIELELIRDKNNSNNNNPADGTILLEGKVSEEEPLFEEPSNAGQPLPQDKNIYTIIESNFGRPLAPFEYETITDWVDKSKYSEELILLAVKEAVTKNTRSIKYIDRILYSWFASGIKTVTEAEQQMENFKAARANKKIRSSRSNNLDTALEKLQKEMEGTKDGI
jgi:DnaD/phage-associated family protein